MRNAYLCLGLILGVLLGLALLAGCSDSARAAPVAAAVPFAPLMAVAVGQCGKLVVMYVVLDATHLLRADADETVLLTALPNGKTAEDDRGPLASAVLMELANRAQLIQQINLPCPAPAGMST